jgi:hypothetical protein
MDMQQGHVKGTCSMDMQVYILKTCSKNIRCSIDMNMEHGRSAWKCSKNMQHGNTAWKYSLDMKYVVHAVWKSGMNAAWTCTVALKCTLDMQQGHAAWTCRMNMLHELVPRTSSTETQQRYAARTGSTDIFY